MKKKFIKPNARIINFETNALICASGYKTDENGWLSPDDPNYNTEHKGWNNPNNPHFPYKTQIFDNEN